MKKRETYSYKGWLNSNSFLKRAFAVLGYSTLAGLIIYGVIILIAIIIWLFFMMFF